MSRRYELKRRAEQQEATRRRIVEAAAELRRTVGPTSATVSRIAEHAGVGRVTVYRHFPDPAALVQACGELHLERNPPPDPDCWAAVSDPLRRLRTALTETYAYYRANEEALAQGLFDARRAELSAPHDDHRRRATASLVAGWGAEVRPLVALRAAIGLALSFDTWRSLTHDDGLTDEEAIGLMLRLAGDALAPATGTDAHASQPSNAATPARTAADAQATPPPPPPEPPPTSSRPLPSARRV